MQFMQLLHDQGPRCMIGVSDLKMAWQRLKMWRLHFLQQKSWPAFFGTLTVSYSSIFLKNN